MSLILDALKRKRPTRCRSEAETTERARADAHSDTVLSTLGYPLRRTRRTGLSAEMLLLYGAVAMAIGFVGLSLLILLFAPPERAQPVPTASLRPPCGPAPRPPVRPDLRVPAGSRRRRCHRAGCTTRGGSARSPQPGAARHPPPRPVPRGFAQPRHRARTPAPVTPVARPAAAAPQPPSRGTRVARRGAAAS